MLIKKHEKFDHFFDGIHDETAKGAINARLARLQAGNAGDCAPVGEGVWELRIHIGRGWRIYYMKVGNQVIVLLGGGEKHGQQRDIDVAIERAKQFKLKK
jgi:putative addiction module killer protein